MRRLWVVAVAVSLSAIGGSAKPLPPTPEAPAASQIVALNDPAVPPLPEEDVIVSETIIHPGKTCRIFDTSTFEPATGKLGEAIAHHHQLYTIRSIGSAPHGDDRSWLVADAVVTASGCAGIAIVWEFVFVAADGAVYQPSPQGRRGEFTFYELPADGWAGGQVFFDLPGAVVRGGAIGLRQPSAPNRHQTSVRPSGSWPVPWPLPEVDGPAAYRRA